MRDDQRRDEARDGERVLLTVLVDVQDHVSGRKRAHFLQVDILGSADLGDAADRLAGMEAEPGPAHERLRESQVTQKLGDARHEADDTESRRRRNMPCARRVDEGRAHCERPRAFLGAPAANRS